MMRELTGKEIEEFVNRHGARKIAVMMLSNMDGTRILLMLY